MAIVFIKSLKVASRIGYYMHEREHPQQVCISVSATVPDRPIRDGVIEDVLNYEELRAIAIAHATEGHTDFVETLADKIANDCLALKSVQSVTVRVEKPDIFPDAEAAGVEVTYHK